MINLILHLNQFPHLCSCQVGGVLPRPGDPAGQHGAPGGGDQGELPRGEGGGQCNGCGLYIPTNDDVMKHIVILRQLYVNCMLIVC